MDTTRRQVNERLAALTAAGTSVWLDQIQRDLIASGELGRLVDEDSLRGVTSNPTIFNQAILGSDDYDDELARLARAGRGHRIRHQCHATGRFAEGEPGDEREEESPCLVVEVLSPSTRRLDTVRKRNDYARIGVRELWLIDPPVPEALITRISPGPAGQAMTDTLVDAADVDSDGMLRSPLLPGFAVRLGDLIQR